MIINLLYVAIGGALGASLRYFVSIVCKLYFLHFPIATLTVNVVGSLIIGLLANYVHSKEISDIFFKYFLIVGLLGSFTTFSAFSIETVELMKEGKIALSFLYIFLSFFLSILAAFIGFYINKISFWLRI